MNFKQTLLRALGKLGQFLAILFQDALRAELEVIMPIALDAVKQVASDPSIVSSPAKRDAALAIMGAQLAKSQVQVATSVIHLGLELAVQNHKAAQK